MYVTIFIHSILPESAASFPIKPLRLKGEANDGDDSSDDQGSVATSEATNVSSKSGKRGRKGKPPTEEEKEAKRAKDREYSRKRRERERLAKEKAAAEQKREFSNFLPPPESFDDFLDFTDGAAFIAKSYSRKKNFNTKAIAVHIFSEFQKKKSPPKSSCPHFVSVTAKENSQNAIWYRK